MREADTAVLMLGVSSYWQVASGYVDVFSHRFIFKTGDPVLNPAHVSLYAASLLGFCAVYLGLRGRGGSEATKVVRPGLLVALLGISGEIVSGVLNETYHRLFGSTPITSPGHLTIHSLFVISMFVVAVGGLTSAALLQSFADVNDRRHVGTSFGVLFSSVWMLLIGSVTYLSAFFAADTGGFYLLVAGGLLASSVSVSAMLLGRRFGLVSVAVLSFFLFNAVLFYGFEKTLYILPAPVLAGVAGEIFVGRLQRLGGIASSASGGAVFGALAYWLLYPYSYSFFDFASIPGLYFGIGGAAMAFAGAAGGLIALLIVRSASSILAARFGSSMRS